MAFHRRWYGYIDWVFMFKPYFVHVDATYFVAEVVVFYSLCVSVLALVCRKRKSGKLMNWLVVLKRKMPK